MGRCPQCGRENAMGQYSTALCSACKNIQRESDNKRREQFKRDSERRNQMRNPSLNARNGSSGSGSSSYSGSSYSKSSSSAPEKLRNGYDTIKYESGSTYTGNFVNNKRHGKGKYTQPDGTYYDGEWKDDMRHGFGIEQYPSGERYEVNYVNDKRHGNAVMTVKDGSIFKQVWDNDVLVSEHQLSKEEIDEMIWKVCMNLNGKELNNYLKDHPDITVPDSVTVIPKNMFRYCKNIKSIKFHEGVKIIESSAFSDSGISSAIIPESVEKIDNYSFDGCYYLKEVVLPSNIIIGTKAFYFDSNMESIKFYDENPTGVEIADGAFSGGKRKYLSQGDKEKVERINSKAFVSKGCYVATCVYGSYDCPEVWTLRRFRDSTLDSTWYGKAFIHTYYAVSPTLVKWFGKTKWFKVICRKQLDRMVKQLLEKGYDNTSYRD